MADDHNTTPPSLFHNLSDAISSDPVAAGIASVVA